MLLFALPWHSMDFQAFEIMSRPPCETTLTIWWICHFFSTHNYDDYLLVRLRLFCVVVVLSDDSTNHNDRFLKPLDSVEKSELVTVRIVHV